VASSSSSQPLNTRRLAPTPPAPHQTQPEQQATRARKARVARILTGEIDGYPRAPARGRRLPPLLRPGRLGSHRRRGVDMPLRRPGRGRRPLAPPLLHAARSRLEAFRDGAFEREGGATGAGELVDDDGALPLAEGTVHGVLLPRRLLRRGRGRRRIRRGGGGSGGARRILQRRASDSGGGDGSFRMGGGEVAASHAKSVAATQPDGAVPQPDGARQLQ
jgi:hypothetical protein